MAYHKSSNVITEAAVSESFYPFVENNQTQDADDIAAPSYTARIAVYDSMVVPPRVVTVPPSDVRTYLDEITKNVWELSTQQGGEWPFHIIRELVENYIHASFIEPTISIMDKGQTISFSDQGPGIPNKEAALRPTFSSATKAMKRYIRGTGSGLPMVEATVRLQHGSISIEDNLGQGAVITVSLAHKDQEAQAEPAAPQAMPQPAQAGQQAMQPAGWGPQAMQQAPQGAGWNPQAMQPYPQAGWPMQGQMGMQAGQAQALYPQGQPLSADTQDTGSYQAFPGYPQQGQQPIQATMMTPGAYAYGQQAWPAQPQQPAWQGQSPTQPGMANPWGGPYQGMQAWPPSGGQEVAGAHGFQTAPGMAPHELGAALPGASWPQAQGGAASQPIPGTPQAPSLNEEVVQVLRLFLTHERIGATEASEALGFSKSTGTRRIQEACEAGFIVKTGQKYVLTAAGRMVVGELAEGR